MRSQNFPREYADKMIHAWALNRTRGFYGEFFPLAMSKQSMGKFASQDDNAFGYTPDTAYFTLDGMFKQGFPKIASELSINHLENYNYHEKWGIPVAPEAYRRDLELFGDQYSNFNAGKILLFLEGFAGLSYSVPKNTLSIRDSLPLAWDWMEVDVPVADHSGWTSIRIERKKGLFGGMQKKISVKGSPLPVRIETWLDGMETAGKPSCRGAQFIEGKATRPNSLTFYTDVSVNSCSVSIPLK
jgi:hypothetical protein